MYIVIYPNSYLSIFKIDKLAKLAKKNLIIDQMTIIEDIVSIICINDNSILLTHSKTNTYTFSFFFSYFFLFFHFINFLFLFGFKWLILLTFSIFWKKLIRPRNFTRKKHSFSEYAMIWFFKTDINFSKTDKCC